MWRVILAGKATLWEIETHWSIDDLMDANEALDLQQEFERRQAERLKEK